MKKLLLIITLSLIATGALAQAGWVDTHIPEARKAGDGMLRYFGLHIYDAELWEGRKDNGCFLGGEKVLPGMMA